MTPPEPSRFDALFHRALALDESELEAFLEQECESTELKQRLREALGRPQAEDEAALEWALGAVVKGPSVALTHVPDHEHGAPDAIPGQVGPYRILEVLGRGGMGVVYLAEQTEPVKRQLALKLIRSSLVGPNVRARFEAERRALARLSHPHISQIFEAGTTGDGFPYFAMEFVDGPPITRYCDLHRLSVDQRLGLFVQVCRGVQHAHQRGIIHRDIKPSNVMVARVEGHPMAKIIDFGIAKALDDPLAEITQLTRGIAVGTPAYMSPESLSVAEAGQPLDTRTDVYALGVLLYELLTGRLPVELEGLGQMQAVARILEEDAPRATRRFAALEAETREKLARRRKLPAAALEKRLAGDLEWIVAKAIARERQRRYASVIELADDIERHLRHEPVSAGPPGLGYRASKFARRNRMAVAAGSVALFAVLVGLIGVGVGFVRARAAEAEARAQAARAVAAETEARAEARTASQVADFLVEIFELADPTGEGGAEITARELLARGAERIDHRLEESPHVRSTLLLTLGRVHRNLGLHATAEPLLNEAFDLRSAHGSDEIARVEATAELGELYYDMGRIDDAERKIDEAEARIDSLAEVPDSLLLELRVANANIDIARGNFEQAETALRAVLPIAEGLDEKTLGNLYFQLARTFAYRGRFDDAGPLFRQCLDLYGRVYPANHPKMGTTLNSLGLVGANLGNRDQAVELMWQAEAIFRESLGEDHRLRLVVLSNLGYTLFQSGRFAEAAPPLEEAVARLEAGPRKDTLHAASPMTNLGLVYWKQKRWAEAEALFLRATAIRERTLEPGHPHRATSLWGLANVYRDQGRHDEAEPLYVRALQLRRGALPEDHQEVRAAVRDYAELLRRTGREAEADELEGSSAP